MRLLIVEPNMDGHRFNYVRILAEAAVRTPGSTRLLTTEDGACAYAAKVTGAAAGLEVVVAPEPVSLDVIAATSRRLATGRVVVPNGDAIAFEVARRLAWRGSGELRLLAMRARAQPGGSPAVTAAKSAVRTALFVVADRVPRVGVTVLESAIGDDARHLLPRTPDPIEWAASDADAERLAVRTGLDRDTYWFAVVGALDERKNIPLVAAAVRDVADRVSTPVGLLLAGRQDERVRRSIPQLRSGGLRLVELDEHLSEADFDAAIGLASCLVLAHSNEGPSGILGKAVLARRRVVAAGAQSLRADCERLGPGIGVWAPLNRPALSEAMLASVRTPFRGAARVAGPPEFAASLLGIAG